ncbi:hypothetical protein ACS0TY_031537 [Phlomoides rotata]
MLRSKSRSRSTDFGHKKNHYSSVFSRTLSASKLCRGDGVGAQVDATAVKFVDKKSNLLENQADRIMSMQQQMGKMEDELRTTKEKLSANQVEKNRVVAQSTSPNKGGELVMEIEKLKNLLGNARDELKVKDKKIGYLEGELGKVKEKEKESLPEDKRRIQELEAEVERKRVSESRMAGSLAMQHNQLDSAMFDLEEAKIEIASLHEKIDGLEDLCNQISREEEGKSLKSEVQLVKESLVKAQEGEKKARLRADGLVEEMEKMKKEWKLAVEGEEKSAKAMEDLAVALKEVATDANQAKEKLSNALIELSAAKEEAERYQNLLEEAKKEGELHKNTADRLRVEAEESVFAWNGKEMGFVSCIKRAEEERAMAQHEKQKLAENLQAAREETYKLRDILKQAVNEANAAKSGAAIAREENSSLKDCLSEKEEALHFITRENERLRISESAAQENVKQLKKMLTLASSEFKIDDKDQNVILMFQDEGSDSEEQKNNVTRAFSFNLEDLKFMNEPEDEMLDEDPEKAEALKGSIFDANAETPKSEVKTPKSAIFRRRMYSTLFSAEEGASNSEEVMDHLNSLNEDSETDKHPHRRSKTMFQRVGGLLTIRKSFHRKEPSSDLKTPTGKKEHALPELKTPTGPKKEVSGGDLKTPTGHKKEPLADLKPPPAAQL